MSELDSIFATDNIDAEIVLQVELVRTSVSINYPRKNSKAVKLMQNLNTSVRKNCKIKVGGQERATCTYAYRFQWL